MLPPDVFPKVFLPNPPGWSCDTPFGVVCPASARGTLHRSSPCSGALPNVLPYGADRSGTPQMRRVLQRGALADSGGGTAGDGQCKIPFVCPIHSSFVPLSIAEFSLSATNTIDYLMPTLINVCYVFNSFEGNVEDSLYDLPGVKIGFSDLPGSSAMPLIIGVNGRQRIGRLPER